METVGTKSETQGGTYSHIFLYRIPKENHDRLLKVQRELSRIYKRHGTLSTRIYQLGKTNAEGFSGFEVFDKALATKDSEEIWLEIDSYRNASEFGKAFAEIGSDAEAGPFWEELSKLTAAHPIIMGEFNLL